MSFKLVLLNFANKSSKWHLIPLMKILLVVTEEKIGKETNIHHSIL